MSAVDFLWAIPVFGVLIFIHELGHFAVAKYFDIRVHEFALGFGPVVVGFDKGETRYNLRAIPLGGFVRMAGMEDGDNEEPRGFNKKTVLARWLVIFAGPFMNFVLASLLLSGFLFFVGTDQAETAHLGDILPTCNVQVEGQNVAQPCPAAASGLQKGDLVLSVDGAPVSTWTEFRDRVSKSQGKPLTLRIQRDRTESEVQLRPLLSEGQWMIGVRPAVKRESLGTALVQGPVMTYKISTAWLMGLWDMVSGRVKPELSGPVGITRTIAEQAAGGLDRLLWLTAFLSINLGMFNLLPIPALDGSRLVFLGVEAVRGRRVDPQRENMVHFVGFMLLIGLMLVITYGEIFSR